MLTLNENRSGYLNGVGDQKLLIVLESTSLDELHAPDAKRTALREGGRFGFGDAGLSDNPLIGPVDAATGELLDGANALDPAIQINTYRGEFTLSKRL